MTVNEQIGRDDLPDMPQAATTPKRSRGLARLAVGLMCVIASVIGNPSSALAANAGTVKCMSERSVVGVWVTVSGGTSGWASWSPWGSSSFARWSYNTQNKPYKLTVGCGGTPARWATSSSTTTFRTNWIDVMCWDRNATYGGGTFYVLGTCTG